MADADTQERHEQCRALTADGERCARPATDNGFCYQHDERDPTVSETETDTADSEAQEANDAETTDPDDVDVSEVDLEVDDDRIEGVLTIRRTVESTATELVGYEFNSVSEISATGDGWRAVVDVVERRAVPDTQDILGRYEIDLDEDGVVEGYRRIDRYRRGDTAAFD
ncbi:gas vesicle protein GvpO, halophile-type [Natronobiforma cellulositropha]|uniref:gas vesicle protein GvpO, halophile-type n=1 Tax=Natronobiforma cellulositropha TaxID=1679076 RepID=UPI0021D5ECA3|nr:gas vesicle protein [Natronobiforma cellulositropha]